MNLKPRLVGSWNLVFWEFGYDDGPSDFPMGKKARGLITYSADNSFSVMLMKPPEEGGPEAENGFFGYAGDFELTGEVIEHHIQIAQSSPWLGRKQRRRLVIEGQKMSLTSDLTTFQGREGYHRLVWRRVEEH